MRYYTLNAYFREQYGCRVQRIPVDAGFTCPNRDGSKAKGGCIFCDNDSFNFSPKIPLEQQIIQGIEHARKRYRASKFMLYFQPYTNTYAPVRILKRIYDHVYLDDRIVALSVGTRADCLSEEVIELLESYTRTHDVWIELGLQSMHERTLRRINRAERVDQYIHWIHRLASSPIKVCVHILFGLPGETREMMHETITSLVKLPIDGIKCHNLHIVKGTVLGKLYEQNPWELMDFETYIELLVQLIRKLPSDVVIHRLTAETPHHLLLAPTWGNEKNKILKALHDALQKTDSYQGCEWDGRERVRQGITA